MLQDFLFYFLLSRKKSGSFYLSGLSSKETMREDKIPPFKCVVNQKCCLRPVSLSAQTIVLAESLSCKTHEIFGSKPQRQSEMKSVLDFHRYFSVWTLWPLKSKSEVSFVGCFFLKVFSKFYL